MQIQEKDWECIKNLLQKLLFHIREQYEIIDDIIKFIHPFESNEEIVTQTIEKLKKMNFLQQEYYLSRLANFTNFIIEYFLVEYGIDLRKKDKTWVDKIKEFFKKEKKDEKDQYN